MRTHLPPNADQPLDFASIIETLKSLEGEDVVLFIDGGPGEAGRTGAGPASRLQAKGILRHYAYGWAEGFALGDGARVLLYERDFIRGHLHTHSGGDLFSVTVQLMNVTFYLGNYPETDEFDVFPKR
jgi:hypothetical protein